MVHQIRNYFVALAIELIRLNTQFETQFIVNLKWRMQLEIFGNDFHLKEVTSCSTYSSKGKLNAAAFSLQRNKLNRQLYNFKEENINIYSIVRAHSESEREERNCLNEEEVQSSDVGPTAH